MINTKVCNGCKELKNLSEFHLSFNKNRGKSYAYHICKLCHKAALKIDHIKRSYSLTEDVYATMIAEGCAICGTQEDLCVDHDHSCCPGRKSCGKCVRGILCRNHNTAEGLLASAEEALALYEYMKRGETV